MLLYEFLPSYVNVFIGESLIIILPGKPTTVEPIMGTSLMTTAPAPIFTLSATCIPPRIWAP